jgi:hypothetical protein
MKILQTANLGISQASKRTDIRYTVYDTLGTSSISATNSGIYEIGSATGLYGVELNLSPQFSGSIVWSVNGNSSVFATEEVKVDQRMARFIHTGRWKIDEDAKQMVFYQDDNETVIARYNLFDRTGAASIDEVFERVYSGST